MRSGNTKGQALAEFILVIPLLLVVLLGVIQFSLLYFAYQMVHYASFTATRAAIVRPCAAFHPDAAGSSHFTPAVFTAAVLATMVAAPPQDICESNGNPRAIHSFLPDLPTTDEVTGLDFDNQLGGGMTFANMKYANAACLTSVQRVESTALNVRPVQWVPTRLGEGPGIPCDGPGDQEQNVPAPGDDLTLEVTLIYPLTVPIVNRVIYGIFVNFSSLAQERLDLPQIGAQPEDVMVHPTRRLVSLGDTITQFIFALGKMFNEFGYSDAVDPIPIAVGMANRAWYPVPVRARCTLTTEGAMYPLTGPPTSRGW